MSYIGFYLAMAIQTFDALPFASRGQTLPRSELRKHSLVRL
jgi:hypothetical protein